MISEATLRAQQFAIFRMISHFPLSAIEPFGQDDSLLFLSTGAYAHDRISRVNTYNGRTKYASAGVILIGKRSSSYDDFTRTSRIISEFRKSQPDQLRAGRRPRLLQRHDEHE